MFPGYLGEVEKAGEGCAYALKGCSVLGVGLVFWGISEPISHYIAKGATEEAAEFAMKSSFMHWGIHPWAN